MTSEPMVYVVSNGCPFATWLASVLARSFPSEWVVCFNFSEVCADTCVATGFEGVCDGEERVAVDVVSLSGWAIQVALHEAEGTRIVCREVGMAELVAYVHAC
jgi:hypothetical protein